MVVMSYMSIFAALKKKNIIMKKYLFNFYEVENDVWLFRSSDVDSLHLAYVVIELPNLL